MPPDVDPRVDPVFAKIGHVLIKIVSTNAASERPLYLQKQTSLNATDMSAMCQKQTSGHNIVLLYAGRLVQGTQVTEVCFGRSVEAGKSQGGGYL